MSINGQGLSRGPAPPEEYREQFTSTTPQQSALLFPPIPDIR